jgi:hypothetical protein
MVCYCSECKGERDLPVEDALRHAAERRGGAFTYELLAAMVAQTQDRGTRISTTTLTTKCLRSEVLQRTEPYTLDPKRGYASFRGTLWHGQLEQHAHPDAKEEPRYHIVLPGGKPFSGSPDLVDVGRGLLYDYKFSKENPRFDYAWKGHQEQGQVNRWLCDHADYVEYRGEFFPLTLEGRAWLENQGIAMASLDIDLNRENFVPVDWQGIYVVYMDDKGPKPILLTKSIQVPKASGEGTKAARVADIWDDSTVERYILNRYAVVEEAFVNITANPTAVPPIEDDFWGWKHPLCDWCAVRDSCLNHFIQGTRLDAAERHISTIRRAS